MVIKTKKKVCSIEIFPKIILYISIFVNKSFKGNVQKMSIEGSSEFRVQTTIFYHNFVHEVKIILKVIF